MTNRIFFGALMFLSSLFLTPWLVLPLATMYALVYFAPELIVFGALIEAYFGFGNTIPIYVIGTSLIVVLAEFIKPHLSFYSA